MSGSTRILRLYIGNLPWTVCHNELRQHFSKYGHVVNATVVFDKNTGISRNYGFIVYSNQEGFDTAVSVQNHKLEGYTLKVQTASNED